MKKIVLVASLVLMSGIAVANGGDQKQEKTKKIKDLYDAEKVTLNKHIVEQMRMEDDGNLSPGGCLYFSKLSENTYCYLEAEGTFTCEYTCITFR